VITSMLQYAYPQAKTRALKSGLLDSEDWRILQRCRRLEDVLEYLSRTAYAPTLVHIPGTPPGADVIALALYDDLFLKYYRLLRSVPGRSARLLKALVSRFECENLKTILRGVTGGRSAQTVRPLLYHLGELSRLPISDLLSAPHVPGFVNRLKHTGFYRPLLHALPQFKAQGTTFPLEIAVDTAAFECILEAVEALSPRDRKGVRPLVGNWIDVQNITWLVRFRFYYDLSSEEVIHYVLRGGRLLHLKDLSHLARSTTLSSFLGMLPAAYRKALEGVREWAGIQPLLDRWFHIQLSRAFFGDPFQIRVEAAYLLLKEIEVRVLEGWMSMLELGEPSDEFLPRLNVFREAGSHV